MVDGDGVLRPLAFGRWLLAQVRREGWVGDLIAAAKRIVGLSHLDCRVIMRKKLSNADDGPARG
jgi:hypothetical protein